MLSLFLNMRKILSFQINDFELLRNKLLAWASTFDVFMMLDSNQDKIQNNSKVQYSSFNFLIGAGNLSILKSSSDPFNEFKNFTEEISDWKFGHLSYDLKSFTEELNSFKPDNFGFPDLFFFQPKWVIIVNNKEAELHYPVEIEISVAQQIIEDFQNAKIPDYINENKQISCRCSKQNYLDTLKLLKSHIYRGDIYEINFCMDFFNENFKINPYSTFLKLNNYSPAPFSAFYKYYDKFLLCTSPERFMKKVGNKLISQPIKGTTTRSSNSYTDNVLATNLKENTKERTENIMITDLVRNDLSRSAKFGSVNVEEICEIYSFKHVHQMISTITCEMSSDNHFSDALKNAFPMGSMTGAPKKNALKFIENYELSRRGLFSGSIGYISPSNDFDFNVVIRSILYNSVTNYLSIHAGSAITAYCDPDSEYEECLLKAEALIKVLEF
jgi:para-aminobenzoate synthetase component I